MIIDFHTHIFPPEMKEKREEFLARDETFRTLYSNPKANIATAEDLIKAMDADGVDMSVVLNIGWSSDALLAKTNDYLVESAQRHPGRLIAFCCVNPASRSAADEIRRCARLGARGVGEVHPDTQRFNLADAHLMAPVMKAALDNGMPVLVHSSEPVGHEYAGKGRTTPDVLMRFIGAYPGAKIICAHWGGGLPFYSLMPEVAKSLGNVYFDTAASPLLYTQDIFRAATLLIGADKILFATDYPLIKPQRLLRQVHEAGLTEAQVNGILAGNAKRLLGIDK